MWTGITGGSASSSAGARTPQRSVTRSGATAHNPSVKMDTRETTVKKVSYLTELPTILCVISAVAKSVNYDLLFILPHNALTPLEALRQKRRRRKKKKKTLFYINACIHTCVYSCQNVTQLEVSKECIFFLYVSFS